MHSIARKLRRLLGLISKIFTNHNIHGDISLLKHIVEYGYVIWEPFKGDENLVEQAQRKATMYIGWLRQ